MSIKEKIISVFIAVTLVMSLCAAGAAAEEADPDECEHIWSEWDVITPASCTESGRRERSCTICGVTVGEDVPAAGHTWGEWQPMTPPSCTEDGERVTTCTVCGATETEIVPAVGHAWGEWTVIDNATCGVDGLKEHTCGVCSETEKEVIPATGEHEWSDWNTIDDQTCGADGLRTRTCAVCSLEDKEILPATGKHTWDDGELTAEPTYWADGERKMTCTTCGATSTVPVERKTNPFADVKLDRWYAEPILYCYDNGLMVGVREDTFSLPASVSRAMIVQIMARISGVDLTDGAYQKSEFADVAVGSWYCAAIEWARSNDMASGVGAGKFEPNRNITRQELAVFLYKLAKHTGKDVDGYSNFNAIIAGYADSNLVASWAIEPLGWAIASETMRGTTSKHLSPTITITRAQLAEVIFNFCK